MGDAIPHHDPAYGDNALNGHAFVPIDDENCMSWCFTHHPSRPLSAHELEVMGSGGGIHVDLIPARSARWSTKTTTT